MVLAGQPLAWQALRKVGLAFVVGLSALAGPQAFARTDGAALGVVTWAQLPEEARQTHRAIEAGGPFPYAKDGSVFGNRERLLPARPRGYYREYTVRTPGARDRGARRIVCGSHEPPRPQACFYTEDHYTSFRRIAR